MREISLLKVWQKYSYREYLQSIRLERACAELVNTNHMLGDIAINNGFANSKAFAKAFKKKNDILPSEYRKRMKQ